MIEYMCSVCGFIYNEETSEKDFAGNIIEFDNIDPEWICPNCGVTQDLFTKIDIENE